MLLGSGLAYAANEYTSSAHGNSSTGVSGRLSGYGTGNCAHCHEQHASIDGVSTGPNPALIFSAEEATCTTCHNGTIVLPNMDFSGETYAHPTFDVASKHTLSILEYGLADEGAQFRGANRHAECADCHEPHTVQAGTHELFSDTTGADNNLISGVLKGVWGVEPTSTEPTWGAANVSYTENKPATMEYQICFKCHSYYALQDTDGVTTGTGPSEGLITDQAMEFSTANKSAHPVKVGLNSQTGSDDPEKLTAAQMKPPWNVADNMGVQTMYCSDCHGNDAATHAGPHGSDNKFLLVGYAGEIQETLHWYERTSSYLWQLNDVTSDNKDNIFCVNCHVFYSWQNEVHQKSYHGNAYCINCHVTVPHGSPNSRLIVYDGDPTPYDYGQAYVTRYDKKASFSYSYDDCACPSGSGCRFQRQGQTRHD